MPRNHMGGVERMSEVKTPEIEFTNICFPKFELGYLDPTFLLKMLARIFFFKLKKMFMKLEGKTNFIFKNLNIRCKRYRSDGPRGTRRNCKRG